MSLVIVESAETACELDGRTPLARFSVHPRTICRARLYYNESQEKERFRA